MSQALSFVSYLSRSFIVKSSIPSSFHHSRSYKTSARVTLNSTITTWRKHSTAMSLSPPTTVLADFVARQKRDYLDAVSQGKGTEWVVAMGNEAGDLDSMASAVAYAWYSSTIKAIPTVPLIQTPRGDLHLREENLYAISLAGLNPKNPEFLCIDDVPASTPFPSNKFALVDHNRLHPQFSDGNKDVKVVAVIDHHEDEELYKDTADPRIIIVPTGSATSLVGCLLQDACPDKVPTELATLLLCGVLIDTNGLKAGGKAEKSDMIAAAFLAPHSLLSDAQSLDLHDLHDAPQIQDLTSTLDDKKEDVSRLDTRDLLRRDYKEYTMTPHWASSKTILVGLASVPVGLKPWMPDDDAFFTSTEQWMKERKVAALGVLTSFRDADRLNKHGNHKHRREQLWVIREADVGVEGLAKTLFKGLEKEKKALDLKKRDFVNDYGVKEDAGFKGEFQARVYKQGNTDSNRKITAPLVMDIIEGKNT